MPQSMERNFGHADSLRKVRPGRGDCIGRQRAPLDIGEQEGVIRQPWTVVQTGPVMLGPADAELHRQFQAQFPGLASADDLDPRRDGIAILEMQRAMAVDVKTAEGLKIVGGFVQLATLHRDGRFETEIIHRWPDRVCECIGASELVAA